MTPTSFMLHNNFLHNITLWTRSFKYYFWTYNKSFFKVFDIDIYMGNTWNVLHKHTENK